MSAEVESMFSVREVPWHGIGTIIQEAVTSKDALSLAGLDWTVRQEEVVYKDQKSGYFMNIRSSDDKVLGVVGGRYTPVQNVDAFDFMDLLLGEGITYETAGCLATGKRIWMLAKLPQTEILGDKVEPYMCLTNSHDGFGSIKVCMTPVRVVCQNTLNLAIKEASRMWSGRHTNSIGSKMEQAKTTLRLASEYMGNLKEDAEELYSIKVTNKDFNVLKTVLFPITNDMSRRKEESQYLLQEQLKEAWEMDDLANIKNTGWGFMNAISDMATHKPPARQTENYQENSFMAYIDAPAILDAAYKLLKSGSIVR